MTAITLSTIIGSISSHGRPIMPLSVGSVGQGSVDDFHIFLLTALLTHNDSARASGILDTGRPRIV